MAAEAQALAKTDKKPRTAAGRMGTTWTSRRWSWQWAAFPPLWSSIRQSTLRRAPEERSQQLRRRPQRQVHIVRVTQLHEHHGPVGAQRGKQALIEGRWTLTLDPFFTSSKKLRSQEKEGSQNGVRLKGQSSGNPLGVCKLSCFEAIFRERCFCPSLDLWAQGNPFAMLCT